VMILETGDSPDGILRPFFDFYFRKVVPRVGGLITGKRFAYEYLNNSSRGFPSRERFVELMERTEAFETTDYRVLMGGASFLYRGIKKVPGSFS
jgi:demethylmenaquinone methyltransferase / 2-methoxy-6-polyprenyl-1,4-benzoquinol methylase